MKKPLIAVILSIAMVIGTIPSVAAETQGLPEAIPSVAAETQGLPEAIPSVATETQELPEAIPSVAAETQELTEGNFTYRLINDNAEVEITDYLGMGGSVEIPSEIDGKPVTCIGGWAFDSNQLTSVTIPESVTSIGMAAFQANQLTSIIIPDSIISIGDCAFLGNPIRSITMPANISIIGAESMGYFAGDFKCYSLNNLSAGTYQYINGDWILQDNSVLDTSEFSYCLTNFNTEVQITEYLGDGGSVKIPSMIDGKMVTSIGTNAFFNKQLNEITIPDSITYIDSNAFEYNQLVGVTIPNSITHIGMNAFMYNQLTSITIPDSVDYIGNAAFAGNKLTSIEIPDSIITIANLAFWDNQLTSIEIPDSITTIGDSAFLNNQLTSIEIPDSITTIGDYAFSNNQLTSIEIPDSIATIGYGTFRNNQLTSIIIPDSVTTIGDFAFENNQLTNVAIPDSVTTIGDCAFENNQLKSVAIPNSVTSIRSRTFHNNKLVSAKIPDSIASIEDDAFRDNELTNIIIPDSVTTIGNFAFQNNQLTSITIPDSVTTIGSFAFEDNYLKSVTIGANVNIGSYVGFKYCYYENNRVAGTYQYTNNAWHLTNTTNTDTHVSNIIINNPQIVIKQFQMADLAYTITPENALNKEVMWSSDNESVARVVNGTIYANKPGKAEITATTMDGFHKDYCTVTVEPISPIIPVTSLSIDTTEVFIGVNDVVTIGALIEPSNSSNRNVIWTNGGTTHIASVDKYGKVTGHKPGVAVIQAAVSDGDNYIPKKCTVNVSDNVIPVLSISLDEEEINLQLNENTDLSYSIMPLNATNKKVDWSSSNRDVATVVGGTIYPHNPGTTEITVTTKDGNKKDSCTVNVLTDGSLIPVSSINLEKEEISIYKNESASLTYSILPENASNKGVEWSSNNENVVKVVNGTIYPQSPGTAQITITTKSGNKQDSCTVHVLDNNTNIIPVSSVSLEGKEEITLYKDQSINLIYKVLPVNATNKDVVWSSSNENIVTVENGTVYPHSSGTAKITVETIDGYKQDSCIVNVLDWTLDEYPLTCDNKDLLSLCKVTDESGYVNLVIDFTDVEKKKKIFNLLKDEELYYEIYYNQVDEDMLYQSKKILKVNDYSDSKKLILHEQFAVHGKYIIKVWAGKIAKNILITLNVKNKSSERNFGHAQDYKNNKKVVIFPYEVIQKAKPSGSNIALLNEIKYCLENYSLKDWNKFFTSGDKGHKYDKYNRYKSMFPEGEFDDYLDAILKVQRNLAEKDAIYALRTAANDQLVAATSKIASLVIIIDINEIQKCVKNNNPEPLIQQLLKIFTEDTIKNKLIKNTIKVLDILDVIFNTTSYVSKAYTLNQEADKLSDMRNKMDNQKKLFYEKFEFLLKDKFEDYPKVNKEEWLEIPYDKDIFGDIVLDIKNAKVYSKNSWVNSRASSGTYVPVNEDEFNDLLNKKDLLNEKDLSKDIIDYCPEAYIYNNIISKTLVNISCPVTVDIYYGNTIVASINDTEPTYEKNEYGVFCSYYQNGDLIKKALLYNPDLRFVIRGTDVGSMNLSIESVGASGLFETTKAVDNVILSPNTVITANNVLGEPSLNVDENGDGIFDKQYTVAEYELPTSLELSQTSISIPAGVEYKLNYSIYPQNTYTNRRTDWWSSNDSIASVDENGLIKANNVGETDVFLSVGSGLSESCHIKVTAASSSSSGSNSGGGGGSSTSKAIAIEEIIAKLTENQKKKIANYFKEEIPYTTMGTLFDIEKLKQVTENKFTDIQLKEIVSSKELLAKLGINEMISAKLITLTPILNASFKDVPSNHWANSAIKQAAELGLVAGRPDGSFAPSESLQVVDTFTFLDRVLLLNNMNDMKQNRSIVEKYITNKDNWAFVHIASISSKLNESTLKTISELGNKSISRELLAQVLYEVTNVQLKPIKDIVVFKDTVDSPYKDAIDYCITTGLLNGTTTNQMSPQKTLTRAELMTVLIRLNDALKSKK